MKKNAGFLLSFVLIAAVSIVNTGCINFTDPTETPSETRPDIDCTNSSIKITIPKISSDTSYINIYRKVVKEDGSDVDSDNTLGTNIGIIFPDGFDDENTTYLFEDKFVISGNYYSYRVRYYDKKAVEFTKTGWTKVECRVTNASDSKTFAEKEDDLKYDLAGAYFEYSDNDKTLTLKNGSSIVAPKYLTDNKLDSKFVTVIALKTEDDAQVFDLSEEQLTAEAPLSLLGTLPASFFNKSVEIVGLVGQCIEETEKDSVKKNKRVYWLEPTKITLKTGNVTLKSFTIGSQTGTNGFDYSYPED